MKPDVSPCDRYNSRADRPTASIRSQLRDKYRVAGDKRSTAGTEYHCISVLVPDTAEQQIAMQNESATVSRRDLLSLIGAVSGSAAMYHAMTSLGFASDTGYKGPIKIEGDPKGTPLLILRSRP